VSRADSWEAVETGASTAPTPGRTATTPFRTYPADSSFFGTARSSSALAGCAKFVRASHERFDGSGYPDGLAGEEIPLGARIISVCDAFDAMTSDRPYRSAMSAEVALDELRRCAGSQFDPVVVAAFCASLTAREAESVTIASPG
jgi:response regulator RpfG family c-di-GMP phosphodiesterase